MTNKIKELISQKKKLYSSIKRRNNSFLNKQLLHSLQHKVLLVLEKTLQNRKKVPCVPPIYHNNNNNRYVTDFKEKCQLFNSYFSEQCILWKNIITLPNTCFKYTNNILDTIVFQKKLYIGWSKILILTKLMVTTWSAFAW